MKPEFKAGDLVKVNVWTFRARRTVRVPGVVVSIDRSSALLSGLALVAHPVGPHRLYQVEDLLLVARGEQNET